MGFPPRLRTDGRLDRAGSDNGISAVGDIPFTMTPRLISTSAPTILCGSVSVELGARDGEFRQWLPAVVENRLVLTIEVGCAARPMVTPLEIEQISPISVLYSEVPA
jgi:hypothetical protein